MWERNGVFPFLALWGWRKVNWGGVLLVGCGGPRSESQRAAHPARDLQATTHE